MDTSLAAALHLATASLAPAFLAPHGSAVLWPFSTAVSASGFLAPRAAALFASAPALLRQLAQASLMGTLFVLAVWLLCRLAPRLPAGLRCALWWLACLKLLLGLAWPAPLALPLLPPAAAAAAGWLAPPAAPAHSTTSPRAARLPDSASVGAGALRAARLPDSASVAAGALRAARMANGVSAAAGAPRAARFADAVPAAAGVS